MRVWWIRILAVVLVGSAAARADERIRPSSADEFPEAKKQTAVRVVGARVAYANFYAIRRDFPQVRHLNDAQISDWLLENFAYISQEQLRLNGIRNTSIPTDPKSTKADYRPPTYGRAGVLEANYDGKPVGLIDIKGLGHPTNGADYQVKEFADAKGDPTKEDAIRTAGHSDGLMRFGEAVAEVSRQTAIQRLYDIHNKKNGTDFETVESYFVIELPFEVMGPKGGRDRAALYGRQAHWRGNSGVATAPNTYRDPFGGLQATQFRTSIDFGGALVDLDPRLKDNFSVFPGQSEGDPQKSKPWAWGHDVAKAFEKGDTSAIYRHIDEMLKPIDGEWRASQPSLAPRSPDKLEMYEVHRIAQQANPSDADFAKLVAFLGNRRSGDGSSFVRIGISRNIHDELAARLVQKVPDLAKDSEFMKFRKAGFFLASANSADPVQAEAAIRFIPPPAEANEAIVKAVLRLAKDFPARHRELAEWLLRAKEALLTRAKDTGKPLGQDPALAPLVEAFALMLDSATSGVSREAARALQQINSAAKGNQVTFLSRPVWDKALSVLHDTAMGKGGDPDAVRFEALAAHGELRNSVPANWSTAPEHRILQDEVAGKYIKEVADTTDLVARIRRAVELSRAGLKDERLESLHLSALVDVVRNPSTEFSSRYGHWKSYQALLAQAKAVGVFPTAEALGEEMVAKQVAAVEARPPVGRIEGYDALLGEGIDLLKIKQARLETLLEMIRDPKQSFHNQMWAYDKYRDTSLAGLVRSTGAPFPDSGEFVAELSAKALDPGTGRRRSQLSDLNDLVNFGVHTPAAVDALLKTLRSEVPAIPETLSKSYRAEDEAIRERIKARALALTLLLKVAPGDPRLLDLGIWMRQNDVIEATQPLEKAYAGYDQGVNQRLVGTDQKLRLLTILSLSPSRVYAYGTELKAAMSDPDPQIQAAAYDRVAAMLISSSYDRWDGAEDSVLTYLKGQFEALSPMDPKRLMVLEKYRAISARNRASGTFPTADELKTKYLADLDGKPLPAEPYERIRMVRAIQAIRGSLTDPETEALRSALTETMQKAQNSDPLNQERQRAEGFRLWVEKQKPGGVPLVSDRDLIVAALRDQGLANQEPALKFLSDHPMVDERLPSALEVAAQQGTPRAAVMAAKALALQAKSDRGRMEFFIGLLRRPDLSEDQLTDVIKASASQGFSDPRWGNVLMDLIEGHRNVSLHQAAVAELVLNSKRSKGLPVEMLSRLSRVAITPDPTFYNSPAKAALSAIGEFGVVHEDLVKNLEEASKTAGTEQLDLIFTTARKLNVESKILKDRAKAMLSEWSKTGKGSFVAPADYLVTRSPILGGFFLGARVREADRGGNYHVSSEAVKASAVKRVKMIASSPTCVDVFTAMHPMSAMRPLDRAMSIGFTGFLLGTVGGGGYFVYSLFDNSPEIGKPELRDPPRPSRSGTGDVIRAPEVRDGSMRKSCLKGGGSMRDGVCVCDAAGGRTMSAWHDLCVKYR